MSNDPIQQRPIKPFWLGVEFLLLCIILPGIIIFGRLAPFMMAFLWFAALYAFLILRKMDGFGFRKLWLWKAVTWGNLKPMLIRWGLASIAMSVFCYFYAPQRFFILPQESPAFTLVLLFLYPIMSALPQELVFCSFFFRRYKQFFGEGRGIIWASAIIFAFAHVLYINPIAPTLSLLGGLIFAQTYAKTRSLALVSIEHALYGNALFVIGLGWYFYAGGVS